jgi:WD40-like Beta Propeller Repeat
MKTIRHLLLTLFISTTLLGCWLDAKHQTGKFMTDVVNLAEFNSTSDDYNSNLPANKYGEAYLIFSSKRDRNEVFNLVSFSAKIEYDDRKNAPVLTKSSSGSDSFYSSLFASGFLSKINGNFNVLGPFVLNQYNLVSYANSPKYQFLFYADDQNKNLDIKVMYHDKDGKEVGPVSLDYLNSKADDAYPYIGIYGDKVFYCSNKEGSFDIYQATIGDKNVTNTTPMIEQLINPKNPFSMKIPNISDEKADDKCPYLWNDNLLVFTSNRAGGFGGYDIYYSVFENGAWSSPINAGPRINTKYDEYRPMLPNLVNFNYPLMIFSSNRPEGKGGFDLYMTGLIEMDNMGKVKK